MRSTLSPALTAEQRVEKQRAEKQRREKRTRRKSARQKERRARWSEEDWEKHRKRDREAKRKKRRELREAGVAAACTVSQLSALGRGAQADTQSPALERDRTAALEPARASSAEHRARLIDGLGRPAEQLRGTAVELETMGAAQGDSHHPHYTQDMAPVGQQGFPRSGAPPNSSTIPHPPLEPQKELLTLHASAASPAVPLFPPPAPLLPASSHLLSTRRSPQEGSTRSTPRADLWVALKRQPPFQPSSHPSPMVPLLALPEVLTVHHQTETRRLEASGRQFAGVPVISRIAIGPRSSNEQESSDEQESSESLMKKLTGIQTPGKSVLGFLQRLVLQYDWIESRCKKKDFRSLLQDFDLVISGSRQQLQKKTNRSTSVRSDSYINLESSSEEADTLETLELVRGAISAAQPTLWKDDSQVGFQLVGRLLNHAMNNPKLQAFIDHIGQSQKRPWLRPISQCLESPKSSIAAVLHVNSEVTSVAICKGDQHVIACGTAAGSIYLWDWFEYRNLGVLHDQEGAILSIKLTADGGRLVSGGEDCTVKLWNVASQECESVLESHETMGLSLAISEDGSHVASGAWDDTIRVWSMASDACAGVLRGHGYDVRSIAISESGSLVVSGSWDKAVRVWNMRSGECQRVFLGHKNHADSVGISESSNLVVSGSWDKTVRVWNISSGECERVLRGHDDVVESVAISESGILVVSGSYDATVRVWNISSGECERVLRGHDNVVESVAISESSGIVLSGSRDKTVRVWNLLGGTCQSVLQAHRYEVRSAAVSESGGLVVSGSWDSTVRVWNMGSGECERVFRGHNATVESVAISKSGRVFVSGSWDKTVRIWNISSDECERVLWGHKDAVESVAISENGSLVVSGSYDATVRVWNMSSGECERVLRDHDDVVESVAISENGDLVVSGSYDQTVRVWNMSSGAKRVLRGHDDVVESVAISEDDSLVVSGSQDKTVRVWSAISGEGLEIISEVPERSISLLAGRDLLQLAGLLSSRIFSANGYVRSRRNADFNAWVLYLPQCETESVRIKDRTHETMDLSASFDASAACIVWIDYQSNRALAVLSTSIAILQIVDPMLAEV